VQHLVDVPVALAANTNRDGDDVVIYRFRPVAGAPSGVAG